MRAVDGRFLGLKWSTGLMHVDTDVGISSVSLIHCGQELAPLSVHQGTALMFLKTF